MQERFPFLVGVVVEAGLAWACLYGFRKLPKARRFAIAVCGLGALFFVALLTVTIVSSFISFVRPHP